MSIPGQTGYMPYNNPYSAPQYDYLSAYRNYMPQNPYAQNQPLNGQNNMVQNMPQQQQPMNNIQFALIPSREVAQNATAEKGQTIYMMNQNNPEIYMKAADGFGLQSTRYFKLVEFNPEQEKQQSQQTITPNVDYIPREEFTQFTNAASAEIANLKQQIIALTQNAVPQITQIPQITQNASVVEDTKPATPAPKKTNTTKESK